MGMERGFTVSEDVVVDSCRFGDREQCVAEASHISEKDSPALVIEVIEARDDRIG